MEARLPQNLWRGLLLVAPFWLLQLEASTQSEAPFTSGTIEADQYYSASHLGLTTIPSIPYNVTTVFLNNNQIVYLRVGLPTTIEKLYLYKNNIYTVPDLIFSSLTRLQNLDLSDNEITFIGSQAFSKTPLTSVNLAGNLLGTLPNLVAIKPTLEYFNIRNNNIKEVPDFAFANFSRLHTLILRNNKVTSIGIGAFKGTHHLSLYLSNNAFKVFPNISQVSLENIYLIGNKISSVPLENVRNLTCSGTLSLINNDLATFPDPRTASASIASLELSQNPLTCDCHVMWVLDALGQASYHALGGWMKVSLDPRPCTRPPKLFNRPWAELQHIDLICHGMPHDLSQNGLSLTSTMSTLSSRRSTDIATNKTGETVVSTTPGPQLNLKDLLAIVGVTVTVSLGGITVLIIFLVKKCRKMAEKAKNSQAIINPYDKSTMHKVYIVENDYLYI